MKYLDSGDSSSKKSNTVEAFPALEESLVSNNSNKTASEALEVNSNNSNKPVSEALEGASVRSNSNTALVDTFDNFHVINLYHIVIRYILGQQNYNNGNHGRHVPRHDNTNNDNNNRFTQRQQNFNNNDNRRFTSQYNSNNDSNGRHDRQTLGRNPFHNDTKPEQTLNHQGKNNQNPSAPLCNINDDENFLLEASGNQSVT
nr:uncharacterized membrane protein DDB_G0293934-like [Drosophila bipectinata]